MAKQFRPYSLDQDYLLPPSVSEWLPENHLARFIAEVTGELNLNRLMSRYRTGGGQGSAGYNPVMLLRLLLYGYCIGVRSSRRIEKGTYDDVAFRYLSADQHPDHDTIANFRKENLESLGALFSDVLRLCREAGMVKLGQVAIDGTKMRANANRNQTMRYRRMEEEEQALEKRVKEILAEAEQQDAKEDAQYGKGVTEKDLPAELETTAKRLAKIRTAKEKLAKQAAERAEQARQQRAANGGKHVDNAARKRYERDVKPVEKANPQHNFTDEDSKIMKDPSGGFLQGYNAQAGAVAGHVIVAAEISSEPADQALLAPMVEAVQQEVGEPVGQYIADAGYFSISGLQHAAVATESVLIRPESKLALKRGKVRFKHPLAQEMRDRLATEAGGAAYRQRAAMIEPVFAYIKNVRGISKFLLRGFEAVRTEWRLICLTHNLLKLRTYRMAQHT